MGVGCMKMVHALDSRNADSPVSLRAGCSARLQGRCTVANEGGRLRSAQSVLWAEFGQNPGAAW